MFTGAIHLTPGQELRTFTVYRDGEHKTASDKAGGFPYARRTAVHCPDRPIQPWGAEPLDNLLLR